MKKMAMSLKQIGTRTQSRDRRFLIVKRVRLREISLKRLQEELLQQRYQTKVECHTSGIQMRIKADPIISNMTFTAADIENRVRAIEKKEQSNSSASTSVPVQNTNAQRAAQRNQVASELNHIC